MMEVPKLPKRIKFLKEGLIICVPRLSTREIRNISGTEKFEDKKLSQRKMLTHVDTLELRILGYFQGTIFEWIFPLLIVTLPSHLHFWT